MSFSAKFCGEEEEIKLNAFKRTKNNDGPILTSSLKCLSVLECSQLLEHIIDYDADVVFLLETWMEADKNDIGAMANSRGYELLHNRRRDRENEVGGGVGVLVKTSITHKQLNSKSVSSFEHTMLEIKLTNNTKLVLITIYRL